MEPDNSNQEQVAHQKMLAKRILVGAVAADFLAVIYFVLITYAENHPNTSVPSILALVYDSMGKIGGTVLFFGLGMIMTVIYAIKMAAIKKQQ